MALSSFRNTSHEPYPVDCNGCIPGRNPSHHPVSRCRRRRLGKRRPAGLLRTHRHRHLSRAAGDLSPACGRRPCAHCRSPATDLLARAAWTRQELVETLCSLQRLRATDLLRTGRLVPRCLCTGVCARSSCTAPACRRPSWWARPCSPSARPRPLRAPRSRQTRPGARPGLTRQEGSACRGPPNVSSQLIHVAVDTFCSTCRGKQRRRPDVDSPVPRFAPSAHEATGSAAWCRTPPRIKARARPTSRAHRDGVAGDSQALAGSIWLHFPYEALTQARELHPIGVDR